MEDANVANGARKPTDLESILDRNYKSLARLGEARGRLGMVCAKLKSPDAEPKNEPSPQEYKEPVTIIEKLNQLTNEIDSEITYLYRIASHLESIV